MPKPAPGTENHSEDKSFDLDIPGDLLFVGCVRRFCLNVLRTVSVSEDVREALGLVVTELCNNSIEHGPAGGKHALGVHIEVSPSRISLRVSGDKAASIDARKLEDAFHHATPGEDKFSTRGRGLFLVSTLMDEVKVEVGRGNGLVVQAVKYLTPMKGKKP